MQSGTPVPGQITWPQQASIGPCSSTGALSRPSSTQISPNIVPGQAAFDAADRNQNGVPCKSQSQPIVNAPAASNDCSHQKDGLRRLDQLVLSLESIERQAEADAALRKQGEEAALDRIQKQIVDFAAALGVESDQRSNAEKTMQQEFEAKLSASQAKLEALFLERFDRLHSVSDALAERLANVEASYSRHHGPFVDAHGAESDRLAGELELLRVKLLEEVNDRGSFEANLATRVAEVDKKTDERLANLRDLCERKHDRLLRDARENDRSYWLAQQQFQRQTLGELEQAQTRFMLGRQSRQQVDVDLAKALNDYTRGFQEAVCSLSRGTVLAEGAMLEAAGQLPM